MKQIKPGQGYSRGRILRENGNITVQEFERRELFLPGRIQWSLCFGKDMGQMMASAIFYKFRMLGDILKIPAANVGAQVPAFGNLFECSQYFIGPGILISGFPRIFFAPSQGAYPDGGSQGTAGVTAQADSPR
jgi:hypothetical protein